MKRSRLIAIAVAVLVVGIVAVVGLGSYAKKRVRAFFYPTAPAMPAEVSATMPEVLARLEKALAAKAPHVLAALQPGLSAEAIAKLEAESGIVLPEDIKALYRWRDGTTLTTNSPVVDFIPTHYFQPLEVTLREKALLKDELAHAPALGRTASRILTSHMDSWISLFSDGAGDGYFFDPQRKPSEGAVFYSFLETGSFTFFPSLKNLLSGIAEGYEQGIFSVKPGSNPPELEEDFKAAEKLWNRFGASNYSATE